MYSYNDFSSVYDNYLIFTTDTGVMSSSSPGATPNMPPGNNEVLISAIAVL